MKESTGKGAKGSFSKGAKGSFGKGLKGSFGKGVKGSFGKGKSELNIGKGGRGNCMNNEIININPEIKLVDNKCQCTHPPQKNLKKLEKLDDNLIKSLNNPNLREDDYRKYMWAKFYKTKIKEYKGDLSQITKDYILSIHNQFTKQERLFYVIEEYKDAEEKSKKISKEIQITVKKIKDQNNNNDDLNQKLEKLREENKIIKKKYNKLKKEYETLYPYVSKEDGERFESSLKLRKHLRDKYGINTKGNDKIKQQESKSNEKYIIPENFQKIDTIFEMQGTKNIAEECNKETSSAIHLKKIKKGTLKNNSKIKVKGKWNGDKNLDFSNSNLSEDDFLNRQKLPIYCIDNKIIDNDFICDNKVPIKYKTYGIKKSCKMKKNV